MIAALIIVFREMVEAGLVVGIVLAVTRNVPRRRAWIAAGVFGGIAGSCIVAAFTGALAAAFEGSGQELFNAAILAVAVAVLAWHNVWMARHGREMASQLKTAGAEVSAGTKTVAALAVVVGIAVMREGSEVVLFLYGIAISDGGPISSLIIGSLLGLAIGALLSGLTYFGLVKIPARYLFAVTSTLIAFLAAGLAAQCVSFLEKAGVVDALGATAWDTSAVLAEGSIVGRVLHTLIGYSDAPSYLQVASYVATLVVIFVLMRVFTPRAAATFRPA